MNKLVSMALVAAFPLGLISLPAGAEVPAAIAVPDGHREALRSVGVGEITYECRAKAGAGGVFEWAFVAPKATLFDAAKTQAIGSYYAGPTWQSKDGSKVTGKQLAVAPAPIPGNIPLQLVQAAPNSGSGEMVGVTYIQRLNTVGGVAPSDPCNEAAVGSQKQVGYQADYVFYKM